MNLQKSNFSNKFDLNIKTYIHELWGERYKINKELIVNKIGNLSRRQPKEYNTIFELDTNLGQDKVEILIEEFFTNFLDGYVKESLSIKGIKNLVLHGQVYLLPEVEKKLKEMGKL